MWLPKTWIKILNYARIFYDRGQILNKYRLEEKELILKEIEDENNEYTELLQVQIEKINTNSIGKVVLIEICILYIL